MKLAKQGRMGFFGPHAGQEASQMASAFAFTDEDWLSQVIVICHKSTLKVGQFGKGFFGLVDINLVMNIPLMMVNL